MSLGQVDTRAKPWCDSTETPSRVYWIAAAPRSNNVGRDSAPKQSSANCCRDRTCGCLDNQMVSATANLQGSNAEGQEECALRAKVLKVVKSNDSVCWCWRATTVQPCAYSPLFEDAVWVVVSFYNVPNGYGWKWWHTWWRRSFHKAIMAVTCHLGRERERL